MKIQMITLIYEIHTVFVPTTQIMQLVVKFR